MTNILYTSGPSGTTEMMVNISKELNNSNLLKHNPYFVCFRNIDIDILNKYLPKSIINLDYNHQLKIKKTDLNYLEETEKKYDLKIWDLWEITASRKKSRRKIPPQKILRWFEFMIKEMENFLKNNEISFYIHYGPASFCDVIIIKMMEKYHIPIIELQPSPLHKRFGISSNLVRDWPELNFNYQKIIKRGMTKKETEKAKLVYTDYINKIQKPDCMIKYKEKKIKQIKRYFKIAKRMIKYWDFLPNYRPLFWGLIQKFYDHYNIFELPVKNEKYILFPLHYQPEASTLIHGKWYNNQLHVIECLIRSIPVNYMLYVKEHRNGYGNRHLNFYKEIKKYPSVRLISPHVNNLDLIENSSLCITISGTTAWEALMFQKQAIFLGDTYYKVFKGITKIDNIKEFPKKIRELLDKKVNLNEAIESISAMLNSTYLGLAFLPGGCNSFSLKKENIKLLAEGINQHIKKLKYI